MATTSSDFVKDPDATLDWVINWSDWLESTEIITASTYIVGTGLTKTLDEFEDKYTTVWLAGGTAGQPYRVTNRVTTSAGRTDERSITIRVKDR